MKKTVSLSLLSILAVQPLCAQTALPRQPSLYSFLAKQTQHRTASPSVLAKAKHDAEDSFDNFAGKWLGTCLSDSPESGDSESFDEMEFNIEPLANGMLVNGLFLSNQEVTGISYNSKNNSASNSATIALVTPNEVTMKMTGSEFFLEPSNNGYTMASSSAIVKWTVQGEELKLEWNINQDNEGQHSQMRVHCIFKKQ